MQSTMKHYATLYNRFFHILKFLHINNNKYEPNKSMKNFTSCGKDKFSNS